MSKEYGKFEIQLFQAGWQLLIQDGLRSFTVEDLAARLGVSKKTIYQTVASREKLIENTIRFALEDVELKILDIIDSEANPLLRFIGIIRYVAAFLSQIPTQRLLDLKLRYPKIWQIVEEFRFDRRRQFQVILQEASAAGYVREDLDVDKFVLLLMQMINSIFQPEFLVRNNLAIPDTIRFFFRIITIGTFTAEGRKHVESF
ncbi:MAG: TetR/AcrR family transcriptional regulator [Candidatus Neomarinimicrobiota bacterium]